MDPRQRPAGMTEEEEEMTEERAGMTENLDMPDMCYRASICRSLLTMHPFILEKSFYQAVLLEWLFQCAGDSRPGRTRHSAARR